MAGVLADCTAYNKDGPTEMKRFTTLFLLTVLLTSCDLWTVQPQPFPVWTPIPTRTPGIVTATPIIITSTWTSSPFPTDTPGIIVITPITPTELPTETLTPLPTDTPTATFTPDPAQAIAVDILGCNTSIDITHGMGEVTNAYVTIKNTGTVDLPNTCSLLRAIDEDRDHPDKLKCVDNLPAQYQITFKLTVDSHYQVGTIIQVDTTSDDVLLLRLDKQSCRDIGIFGGAPDDVGVVKPIED
ncbi:MAG: hypothetical protein AB1649_23120 [Chloroflexota bacterium]